MGRVLPVAGVVRPLACAVSSVWPRLMAVLLEGVARLTLATRHSSVAPSARLARLTRAIHMERGPTVSEQAFVGAGEVVAGG